MRRATFCYHNLATLRLLLRKAIAPSAAEIPRFGVLPSMPDLDGAPDPLPWTLPGVSTDDRVFWAGDRRVVVGPAVLAPRAIAIWSE